MSNLSTRWKFVILATAIGAVSVPLSLLIFPPPKLPPGMVLPPAALVALIGLKLLEGAALGTGISFLVFGYAVLKRAGQPKPLTVLAYASIAWYLVNWWPHDNLHFVLGASGAIYPLLAVEYAFHQTLIAGGVILALFFYQVMRQAATRSPRSRTPLEKESI
jgi:hypothetical protein